MERERKEYEFEDIERLLAPKCDFHTSPGFKELLMAKAGAMAEAASGNSLAEEKKGRKTNRKGWQAWPVSAGIAAAVVAAVILTVGVRYDGGNKVAHGMIANLAFKITEQYASGSVVYGPAIADASLVKQEATGSGQSSEKDASTLEGRSEVKRSGKGRAKKMLSGKEHLAARVDSEETVGQALSGIAELEGSMVPAGTAEVEGPMVMAGAAIVGPMRDEAGDYILMARNIPTTDVLVERDRTERLAYIEKLRLEMERTESFIRKVHEILNSEAVDNLPQEVILN